MSARQTNTWDKPEAQGLHEKNSEVFKTSEFSATSEVSPTSAPLHPISPPAEPRLPVWLRLARLASSMTGWALLSILAGAATVLSGVGLMATSAYIISAAALQPSIAVLQVAIVGVRFFGIARGLFRYLERYLSHQATFRLLQRLRVWFYQALEPLAPAALQDYRSGDLLARILGDIQSLEDFYVRALAPPFTAILALSIVFIYISSFSLQLALALLLFWLLVGLVLPVVVRLLSRQAGEQLVIRRAALSSATVDFVQGLPDLQVYGQARRSAAEIADRGQALARVQRQLAGCQWLPGCRHRRAVQPGHVAGLVSGDPAGKLGSALRRLPGGLEPGGADQLRSRCQPAKRCPAPAKQLCGCPPALRAGGCHPPGAGLT